jgi:hypothetical protein
LLSTSQSPTPFHQRPKSFVGHRSGLTTLYTFSSTIQAISTDCARFRELIWLIRIGKQRMQVMEARIGSRMADSGLEREAGSAGADMVAAMGFASPRPYLKIRESG